MGILEAFAVSHEMVKAQKKYKKSLKNTYTDILIRGSFKMLKASTITVFLILSIIEPELIVETLIYFTYSQEPHRLTPVTKFNFFLSETYLFFAVTMLIAYVESVFITLSAMSGGYCIPKKP